MEIIQHHPNRMGVSTVNGTPKAVEIVNTSPKVGKLSPDEVRVGIEFIASRLVGGLKPDAMEMQPDGSALVYFDTDPFAGVDGITAVAGGIVGTTDPFAGEAEAPVIEQMNTGDLEIPPTTTDAPPAETVQTLSGA